MELYITNTYNIEKVENGEQFLNIEGYACHFGQMNLNEQVVDAHSFDLFFDLYKQNKITPRLNYEHSNTVIGGIDKLERTADGVYMTAHLNKEIPVVNDMIIPNILAGDIKSFSTEGLIKGGYNGIVELETGYYIKNFILTGVSVVSTPADWDAEFSVANVLKGFEEWKLQNAVKENNKKIYLFL